MPYIINKIAYGSFASFWHIAQIHLPLLLCFNPGSRGVGNVSGMDKAKKENAERLVEDKG
jgi:hypothetical protein